MSLLTGKASDFLKIGAAAAGRGDMDTVRAVLEERPDWVTRTGSHGRTMLWEAAYPRAHRNGRLPARSWRGHRRLRMPLHAAPGGHLPVLRGRVQTAPGSRRQAARARCPPRRVHRCVSRRYRAGLRIPGPRSWTRHRRETAERPQSPGHGAALCRCRRTPGHRLPVARAARGPPALRRLPRALLHVAAPARHPRTPPRRWPGSLNVRSPAFRRHRSGNPSRTARPGRRVETRSCRGRLASHRLPVAGRPWWRCRGGF